MDGDHDFGTSSNIAQSYVVTTHDALGRYSVGLRAIRVHGALEDVNGGIGPVS